MTSDPTNPVAPVTMSFILMFESLFLRKEVYEAEPNILRGYRLVAKGQFCI